MTVNGFLKGVKQVICFLFLTPSWSSKRRAEQQSYEERLNEAVKCAQLEKK